MFVPYARNTVIRAYFDKYVDRKVGATLEEVATALGYVTKNISDAVFPRPGKPLEYRKIGKARHASTNTHKEGWNAAEAERVLEDHLSGRHRVDGMESRAKAEVSTSPYQSRRVSRPKAEDWSGFHFWTAVMKAMEELGAILKGSAKEVTADIKPKLAEHKVQNLDRVASTLTSIRNRLGWVDIVGADPARWHLTPEYLRLTPEERDEILSQWDDDGNRLTPQVDLVEPEATPGEEPVVLLPVQPEEAVFALVGHHHFEIEGEAYGLGGARARVEVDVPLDVSYKERLALQRFILAVREELLKLA